MATHSCQTYHKVSSECSNMLTEGEEDCLGSPPKLTATRVAVFMVEMKSLTTAIKVHSTAHMKNRHVELCILLVTPRYPHNTTVHMLVWVPVDLVLGRLDRNLFLAKKTSNYSLLKAQTLHLGNENWHRNTLMKCVRDEDFFRWDQMINFWREHFTTLSLWSAVLFDRIPKTCLGFCHHLRLLQSCVHAVVRTFCDP